MPINPPNLLALQACLLPEDDALHAWNQLKELFTIDDIDFALLPSIFSNLAPRLDKDDLLGKLKGCHHYQWSKNQFLLHELAERLRSLDQAGIEMLLLGDAAVASGYYKKPGDRMLFNFEAYVPGEQLSQVTSLLDGLGQPSKTADKFGFSLTVRSNILLGPGRDKKFWSNRTRTITGDATICVLDHVDQLFYTLLTSERSTQLMWITDVWMVASKSDFNPQVLAQRAQQYRVAARLKDKVNFFYSLVGSELRLPVLDQIANLNVNAYELIDRHVPGFGALTSATLAFTRAMRGGGKATKEAFSD